MESEAFVPTLRKQTIEGHFDEEYCNSLKNALFKLPSRSSVPQDIPQSLKEACSDLDAVHSCDQCKDCFRFASSLEAHCTRRSWVLGYWCQACFVSVCNHVPRGSPTCINCLSAQLSKSYYLQKRGLKLGKKAAIIRVFYNQCQFFTHLKSHNQEVVEDDHIMLMPIPDNVEMEDNQKLEKACKALMEHGFLNDVHIMEFLQQQKAKGAWWDPHPINSDSHVPEVHNLAEIINNFDDTELSQITYNPSGKNTPIKVTSSVNKNSTANHNNSTPEKSNASLTNSLSPSRFPMIASIPDCTPGHGMQTLYLPNPLPQDIATKPTKDLNLLKLTSTASNSSDKIDIISASNTIKNTHSRISVRKFALETAANWAQEDKRTLPISVPTLSTDGVKAVRQRRKTSTMRCKKNLISTSRDESLLFVSLENRPRVYKPYFKLLRTKMMNKLKGRRDITEPTSSQSSQLVTPPSNSFNTDEVNKPG